MSRSSASDAGDPTDDRSSFAKLSRVLVRLDHVASVIVNANYSIV
ncbi:MAG: hypothetical protein WA269_12180 [Candidatus Udaeobacter sp.]